MSDYNLPYLATTGNIPKAFERIKSVPTPPRVTQDFVKTKLQIPSGSGDAMTSFLRKLGLVNPDGTPSELYIKARNPVTSAWAVSQAFRQGYAPPPRIRTRLVRRGTQGIDHTSNGVCPWLPHSCPDIKIH